MNHSRTPSLATAAFVAFGLTACGGGSPSAPNGGPSPSPIPTATPTPTPAPTPDPRAGLPPGPVVRVTLAIRTVDEGNFTYRTPEQDPDTGRWILFLGEFVVIDSNPRNGAGDVCTYVNDPVYTIQDPGGAITRLGSSNPFLLRFDVTGRGEFDVSVTVDGVQSPTLLLEARGNNQR